MNNLQERALRIIHSHHDSSFFELLQMSNESTINTKNIKVLMTEIYRFLNDLSLPVINDIF